MNPTPLGVLLSPLGIAGEDTTIIEKVTKDTREDCNKALYVAIKGEKFDGARFTSDALARGAVAAIGETVDESLPHVYKVENDVAALLAIGGGYRKRFDIPVVGVTGSVGKTSTRRMIASVLGERYKVCQTKGNYNNEIGLPLSLMELDDSHGAAVFELGMSARGEISRMTAAARPTACVITNIGVSHIGLLGSQENILAAKLEILEGMDKETGVLIINGDDPRLWAVRNSLGVRTVTFGIENAKCDVLGVVTDEGEHGSEFIIERGGEHIRARVRAPGRHHIMNALAAYCAGTEYGVTPEQTADGIAKFEPEHMRGETRDVGGVTYMVDCYNASPDSMRAAFGVAKTSSCSGKRIAVLGGMREMGAFAPAAHREIGAAAAEVFDELIVYGENSEYFAEGALERKPEEPVFHAGSHAEIAGRLRGSARAGDLVLLKGSRAMELEKVLELL